MIPFVCTLGNSFLGKSHFPENPYPPNLGGADFFWGVNLQKSLVLKCFLGAHSLNSGGEIFTPRIWGVWVFRVQLHNRTFAEYISDWSVLQIQPSNVFAQIYV